MPISYRIDKAKRRLYTHATGLITFDDLKQHMNTESGTPAASYAEIFDCTEAMTNMTAEEVRALALERQRIAQHQHAAPAAVVATNDVFYGMFRMFDALTENVRPLNVFRDIAEAEKWLDEIMGE